MNFARGTFQGRGVPLYFYCILLLKNCVKRLLQSMKLQLQSISSSRQIFSPEAFHSPD